jgi:hypothetical protein
LSEVRSGKSLQQRGLCDILETGRVEILYDPLTPLAEPTRSSSHGWRLISGPRSSVIVALAISVGIADHGVPFALA